MSDTEPTTDEVVEAEPKKKGLGHRLYHGETAIDFMGQRRRWFIVSALVILSGVASLLLGGLNLGIDFRGGTAWEVKSETLDVPKVRDELRGFGLADAKVTIVRAQAGGGRFVRVQGDIKGETTEATNK